MGKGDFVFFNDHPDRLVNIGGEWRRDVVATVGEERIKKMAQGYMCIQCFEDFRPIGPYPETCPMCGYEVAKNQQRDFEQNFQGIDWEWLEVAKKADDAGIYIP